MGNIEQLKLKVLSANSYSSIAQALLDIDYALTETQQKLNLSGNMTDKAIIELEGFKNALETLSLVGRSRVQEIQNASYKRNKENAEFRKIVRREVPERYQQWIQEARSK